MRHAVNIIVPSLILILMVSTANPTVARKPPAQWPEPVSKGTVKSVTDGDTLVLQNGTEVRLVGIQAPKLPLGRKNFSTWPLAPEAKTALGELSLGKELTLKYGGRKIDRHGRLLAHLYLDDGKWIQGALLQAGMARVYSFPDNRSRIAEMLKQETAARSAKRGIWGHPYYRIINHRQTGRHLRTFQLIEGTVVKAVIVRGRAYLNFDKNWRKDFTITMSPRTMRRFWRKGPAIDSYQGKTIRVRGWLKKFNGPMIEASHPEQIEILE
ncbi:MAG: thermonuclease family protein [Alphaproteobacteria bacterium]|nr:thermonuclease family protein [Alphaproteobacteria bacterium]